MRKPVKLNHSTNMFGTTVSIQVGEDVHVLADNLEKSFKKLNKRIEKGYWFRSTETDLSRIRDTVRFLENLEQPFHFQLWHDDGKWDMSLRVSDETDAATVAWSLNGILLKWTPEEEADLKRSRNQKPLKARVTKDGKVKVKITVASIPDA
jgi:transcriptional regulator